jgi:hypothetical protein
VLPSSSIIFRAEGTQVATVNQQNKADLHKVLLGHDFGDTIQILNGVSETDSVIANPPDSVTPGMPVSVQSSSDNHKGN